MSRQSNPRFTTLRRAPGRLSDAIGFVGLVLSSLAALVLIVVPMVTGSQPYSVLTNSMKPNYAPGTLMVVKPTDFDALTSGDVVTYQLESGRPDVITHRIVSITADQEGNRLLITKGDNNDAVDETPVTEVQIRGKLFYAVPFAGYVANWLGQQDRGLAADLAAGALFVYGAVTIVRGVRARRKTPAAINARVRADA